MKSKRERSLRCWGVNKKKEIVIKSGVSINRLRVASRRVMLLANQRLHFDQSSLKCSPVIGRHQPSRPDGTRGRLVDLKNFTENQIFSRANLRLLLRVCYLKPMQGKSTEHIKLLTSRFPFFYIYRFCKFLDNFILVYIIYWFSSRVIRKTVIK